MPMSYMEDIDCMGMSNNRTYHDNLQTMPLLSRHLLTSRHSAAPYVDKGEKCIKTFNTMTHSLTKDLRRLVLAMVVNLFEEERIKLDGEMSNTCRDMTKMRLQSFLLKFEEVAKYPRVALLKEAQRLGEELLTKEDLDCDIADLEFNEAFPHPIKDDILQHLPADSSELHQSEVATINILTERGQDVMQNKGFQLYGSKYLNDDVAVAQPANTFEEICSAYKSFVTKAVEVGYIEEVDKVVESVHKLVDALRRSEPKMIDYSLALNHSTAQRSAPTFLQETLSHVMKKLMKVHEESGFNAIDVKVAVKETQSNKK